MTNNPNNPIEAFILNVTTSIGDPPPFRVLLSIKNSKLVSSKQTKIHIYQSSMILKSETQKSIMMGFIFTRISKSETVFLSSQVFDVYIDETVFTISLTLIWVDFLRAPFVVKEGGGISPCLKFVRIMQNV